MSLFTGLSVQPSDLHEARIRIASEAVRTPLLRNPHLDAAAGAAVWLKPENLQRTGSFKFRGAFNAISALDPEVRRRGVLAWSSGNHAQAVAASARILGTSATIIMPADAPAMKRTATEALGATVVPYDRYKDVREDLGTRIAKDQGLTIIPPYDHPPTIAGQGTAGLEIADDLAARGITPDVVFVCCGGGGLTAGMAIALRNVFPDVAVYAVEPADFDDTRRSLAAGERLRIAGGAKSICDSIMTPEPGTVTFPINQRLLAGAVTVSDDAAGAAMRFAYRHLKLVVEPGGAVALAAVLGLASAGAPDLRGRTAVAVLSGGNVDPGLYSDILARAD